MTDCSYCQQTLPEGARRCPRCGTPAGRAGEEISQSYQRHGTLVEPLRPTGKEAPLNNPIRPPTVPVNGGNAHPSTELAVTEESGAVPFRPVYRPSMALLTILDDGQREKGEVIRLRAASTLIGRTHGDILIPHDQGISGTHAEIVRESRKGLSQWSLRDRESRNGTFVRITRAKLTARQHILIGSRRFRFDEELPESKDDEENQPKSTRHWREVSADDLARESPSLVELTPDGEGQRHRLTEGENFIGTRAGDCHVVLADDPFVSPLHCCVRRDEEGRWVIENRNSLNGVWLRISSLVIHRECEFQLGEQRFTLRILS